MIGLLTNAVMATVDTLFIGQLGIRQLAAVPLAAMVYLMGWIALVGVMRNSIAFVGRAYGAGKWEEIDPIAGQYRLLAWVALPLLWVYIQVWPFFTGLSGVSPQVQAFGWAYLGIRVWDVPFSLSLMLYSSIYQAIGNSRFPMLVSLLVMGLNVVMDYALIFGKWGFPAMGVEGSAWATVLAQVFGAGIIVVMAHKGRLGRAIALSWWTPPEWKRLRQILRIGVPMGLGDFVEISAWTGFTLIVARLGEVSLAANNIGMQVTHLLFLPGLAIGIAASSYMGRFLGAGHPELAYAAARRALILGLCYMGLLGMPLWFWGEAIAGAFTDDAGVVRQAGLMFKVMALYQVFDGAGFITRTALSGAGDTRVPTLLLISVVVGILYPLSWWLSTVIEPQLLGAWAGAFVYMVAMAGLMLGRFHGGRWRSIQLHP